MPGRLCASLVAITLLAALSAVPAPARAQDARDTTGVGLAREILEQLVGIRTTAGTGNTVKAAEAMAARLRNAGLPDSDVHVLGPEPGLGNLVARLRGNDPSASPILMMAHLDVVDAVAEAWSVDPFELTERDGWLYGRGSTDDKAGDAVLVANLIRLKREGFVPDRDLVIVLTADEETTGRSIDWLVKEHRDLIDAGLALNTDAGSGILEDGRPFAFTVQTSEKVYLSFQLQTTNPGGHSSLPTRDNAIYHLAGGLARLAAFQFPRHLNATTRGFFRRWAELESGSTAADMRAVAADPPDTAAADRLSASPYFNALLRTTCVATRLAAGHADNALPRSARAVVNCRILPQESPDEVERTLERVLADTAIAVSRVEEPTPSPPSPLDPDVMRPVERIVASMWPGTPVIPEMSTGATDGLFIRNGGIPVYGVSAIFEDPNDVRAHGKDERISIRAFQDALEFWYRMMKALAGGDAGSS